MPCYGNVVAVELKLLLMVSGRFYVGKSWTWVGHWWGLLLCSIGLGLWWRLLFFYWSRSLMRSVEPLVRAAPVIEAGYGEDCCAAGEGCSCYWSRPLVRAVALLVRAAPVIEAGHWWGLLRCWWGLLLLLKQATGEGCSHTVGIEITTWYLINSYWIFKARKSM